MEKDDKFLIKFEGKLIDDDLELDEEIIEADNIFIKTVIACLIIELSNRVAIDCDLILDQIKRDLIDIDNEEEDFTVDLGSMN